MYFVLTFFSVSESRKKGKRCSYGENFFISIGSLKSRIEDHLREEEEKKKKEENGLFSKSPISFDFCAAKSKTIFNDEIVLIGKIVLNRKTGNFELSDNTGSIPICPVEKQSR